MCAVNLKLDQLEAELQDLNSQEFKDEASLAKVFFLSFFLLYDFSLGFIVFIAVFCIFFYEALCTETFYRTVRMLYFTATAVLLATQSRHPVFYTNTNPQYNCYLYIQVCILCTVFPFCTVFSLFR